MDPIVAILVLASAAIHPFWNLLLKRETDPQRAYLALTATLSLCGLVHAIVAGEDLLAVRHVLPLILLSWCGQVLYGTCLTATLQRGDLSAYYPIIRASPVFIVIVGVLLLGKSYAAITLLGIALAVSGGFLLLYRRGARLLSDPGTLVLALAAMAGTGIYSMADAQLMKSITPAVQMFWIEGSLIPVFLMLFLKKGGRLWDLSDGRSSINHLGILVVPGILAYISYYMILHAYRLGGEVAAVTSVRQASIPISVLLGGYFLREGSILRRLIASSILAAGIIIIVTAR
ncbi:MAG: EamA family transporter [Methyloligellaceae bacterium]